MFTIFIFTMVHVKTTIIETRVIDLTTVETLWTILHLEAYDTTNSINQLNHIRRFSNPLIKSQVYGVADGMEKNDRSTLQWSFIDLFLRGLIPLLSKINAKLILLWLSNCE